MDTRTDPTVHRGDADIAAVAGLFADRTRARVLTALVDGRSLPAGVLAAEAGVSAQAASAQLARLRDGGLIEVEQSGRHRYYRLASTQVATIMEGLAAIAPAEPIRSLRQGTRAEALRRSRTCYDHLAGRLGCAVNDALLAHGVLERSDGRRTTERRADDRLSAPVASHPYRIGPAAADVLGDLGLPDTVLAEPRSGGRPVLRFCVDWSEQRHHLGGRLGADLLTAFIDAGWIKRRTDNRAVDLTDLGAAELHRRLGVEGV
jgi:DNA-binding transcriptional ArsR family regulator